MVNSFEAHLQKLAQSLPQLAAPRLAGQVIKVAGMALHAVLPGARVGELCHLRGVAAPAARFAEVVGLDGRIAVLMPLGDMDGISTGVWVEPTGQGLQVTTGDAVLGRVLDGLGQPIDGKGALPAGPRRRVLAEAPAPMSRQLIQQSLTTGIRAIDGLLTCAQGQRIGIFAAAGGGKSTLLSMLLRQTQADVCVAALIGERGREVREFVEQQLGPAGLARSVVVAATSDRPAMERIKAAQVATTLAESFRDQGLRVLLVMDSVTRFARALREVGLAAGEPPARRGFPPSVFAALPRLLERGGAGQGGSITAFYTVLVEGDDLTEPVADEVRSLVDGHIVLCRKLAAQQHYPAIDILASTSRLMGKVVSSEHQALAARARQLLAHYQEVEILLRVGEYQAGQDPDIDLAVDRHDVLKDFLCQGTDEQLSQWSQTLAALEQAVR